MLNYIVSCFVAEVERAKDSLTVKDRKAFMKIILVKLFASSGDGKIVMTVLLIFNDIKHHRHCHI